VNTAVRAGQTAAEFDRAARRYDLLVALNPGYHAHLRAAADRLRALLPDSAAAVVDLGCGSGASTRALLDRLGEFRVVTLLGIDASRGMLARASGKRWPSSVRFAAGRAEQLGDLVPEPVDGVFAAYLFRNVAVDDRDATLRAVRDALRPGGALVVQEYSVAGRLLPTAIWTFVCWFVVVPLAVITSGRATLYRYLWRSVLRFDTVEGFAERLRRAGFTDVAVETVPGWQHGILHTFRARRPE
jgi:ubiquinone/menaquinone biosynthesis C-methylase UbiE